MRVTRTVLPALLLILTACGRGGSETAAGAGVENPDLGVAIARVPQGCEVARNAGTTLELTCTLEGSPGTLTIEEGEPGRVNLVELAKAQKESFEALPGGKYFGNRELVTPTGSAYTARGSYEEQGRTVEETRVIALHPSKDDRPLVFRFRYPTGEDTQKRVDQLLYVVGEVEAPAGEPAATPNGES